MLVLGIIFCVAGVILLIISKQEKIRVISPQERKVMEFERDTLRRAMMESNDPTERALRSMQLTDVEVDLQNGYSISANILVGFGGMISIFVGIVLILIAFFIQKF